MDLICQNKGEKSLSARSTLSRVSTEKIEWFHRISRLLVVEGYRYYFTEILVASHMRVDRH
jgi:hypothetical protein